MSPPQECARAWITCRGPGVTSVARDTTGSEVLTAVENAAATQWGPWELGVASTGSVCVVLG